MKNEKKASEKIEENICVYIPKRLQDNRLRFTKVHFKSKSPIGLQWNKECNSFSWQQIDDFLKKNNGKKNYGVLCGFGGLVVIDIDVPEFQITLEKLLPPTYRVRTGRGGTHNYYFIPELKHKINLEFNDSKKTHLGEIQTFGQQVIAPNSLHETGNQYKEINDLPITTLTFEELFKNLQPFIKQDKILTEEETKKELEELKKIRQKKESYKGININEVNITDVFSLTGMKKSATKGEYYGCHPIHNSTTGMNFWINPSKNLFKCFRHNTGGDVGIAIAMKEGLIDCSDAKKGVMTSELMKQVIQVAQEKYGLAKEISSKVVFDKGGEEEKIEVSEKTLKKFEGSGYDILELRGEILNLVKEKNTKAISQLIAEEILNNEYIYTIKNDANNEMWFYEEGIYLPNGKCHIKQIARELMGMFYSTNYIKEIITKIEADTFISSDNFFKDDNINEIPVQNGILNIFTKAIFPFTPEKIFFNKLPIRYNPDAKCPAIEKHFKDVLRSPDDAKVFFEIIGFLLYKEYFIEKAIMLVGEGRNGKSKTLDLIKRFLGSENCSAIPLNRLKEDSFSISELFGKMVNLAGDISSEGLKETGVLKSTIGRDNVSGKRKFKSDLTFMNYAKHIFACNQLPFVNDSSLGFWKRWILFEFPFVFLEKKDFNALSLEEKESGKYKILDTEHIQKISTPEELSGLLNKAIEGLENIKKNKEFSYSIGSGEIKKFWIRKANSFLAFCLDNLEEQYNSMVLKKDLRFAYTRYCKTHQIKMLSDAVIKRTLEEEFGAYERQTREYDRERIWEGFRFKENSIFSPSNFNPYKTP